MEQFHTRLVKQALSMEGTCAGEHGIGVGKIDCLVDELGNKALDPNRIMNPGKIIADTFF